MNRVMKSLLVTRGLAFTALLLFTSVLFAQIPAKPAPPRLVNDFASIFVKHCQALPVQPETASYSPQ